MRPVPNRRVFSRREGLDAGWTDAALHRAVRAGRLLQPCRGFYAVAPKLTPDLLTIAVHRACAGSAISHRSAALMDQIPVLGRLPALPELTLPPFAKGHSVNAHIHRAQLRPEDLAQRDDAVLTSPARTVVDLARQHVVPGIVAMDAVVQRKMATFAEIDDVLRFCWNWPGIRRAQRSRRLADGLAESPLETLSRLTIRRLPVPKPRPQAWILDHHGRIVGRADFYWEKFGVVGEVDGRSKYTARDILINEKARQEDFEDLGLVVTRWGMAEVRSPIRLERKLQRAFERGAARDRSGLRRQWSVSFVESAS